MPERQFNAIPVMFLGGAERPALPEGELFVDFPAVRSVEHAEVTYLGAASMGHRGFFTRRIFSTGILSSGQGHAWEARPVR